MFSNKTTNGLDDDEDFYLADNVEYEPDGDIKIRHTQDPALVSTPDGGLVISQKENNIENEKPWTIGQSALYKLLFKHDNTGILNLSSSGLDTDLDMYCNILHCNDVIKSASSMYIGKHLKVSANNDNEFSIQKRKNINSMPSTLSSYNLAALTAWGNGLTPSINISAISDMTPSYWIEFARTTPGFNSSSTLNDVLPDSEYDIHHNWRTTNTNDIYHLLGNVGIKTNTPSEALDVAGTVRLEALKLNDTTIDLSQIATNATNITNNDTDIVALQAQITSNDNDITGLQTQITNNDTDIVALQAQITSNDNDITGLQTQITNNDTDIVALQAQITSNDNDIALKSNIASPTFSGTPAVPTPATSTNTTQIASTAFVQSRIAELIGNAPAGLDTLQELGDAINDDDNFAATVTNSLSLKANIASPTFTGTVGGITKSMVGLSNADNTSDTNKPISTATQTALNGKQNTIGDGDLTIARTNGLQAALDAKQATITDGDLTIARTNGLQAALDAKQATITDGDLTIARTNGLQAALDGKQATIGDGDLTIARTNGLQAALDAKQATITDGDLTIARTNGLQTALDSKAPTTDPVVNKIDIGDGTQGELSISSDKLLIKNKENAIIEFYTNNQKTSEITTSGHYRTVSGAGLIITKPYILSTTEWTSDDQEIEITQNSRSGSIGIICNYSCSWRDNIIIKINNNLVASDSVVSLDFINTQDLEMNKWHESHYGTSYIYAKAVIGQNPATDKTGNTGVTFRLNYTIL